MNYLVYDIYENDYWYERLLDKIKIIPSQNHPKHENYMNFDILLQRYKTFNIIVSNNEILAMAGINTWRWDEGVARVLDKSYYFNWRERSSKLNTFVQQNNNYPRLLTEYILPTQYEWCRKNNFSVVMISTENYKRRRVFNKQILGVNDKFGYNFKLLDGMRKTCSGDKSCWQNIHIDYLQEGSTFVPEYMSIEEYKERYE